MKVEVEIYLDDIEEDVLKEYLVQLGYILVSPSDGTEEDRIIEYLDENGIDYEN